MNEPLPPQPEPGGPAPVIPLEYAPPPRPAWVTVVQCIFTCGLTCAAIVGSGFLFISAGGIVGVILMPLIILVVMAITAVSLQRMPDRRALAASIWIGIGLAVLLEGVCWFGLSGMRIGG